MPAGAAEALLRSKPRTSAGATKSLSRSKPRTSAGATKSLSRSKPRTPAGVCEALLRSKPGKGAGVWEALLRSKPRTSAGAKEALSRSKRRTPAGVCEALLRSKRRTSAGVCEALLRSKRRTQREYWKERRLNYAVMKLALEHFGVKLNISEDELATIHETLKELGINIPNIRGSLKMLYDEDRIGQFAVIRQRWEAQKNEGRRSCRVRSFGVARLRAREISQVAQGRPGAPGRRRLLFRQ